MGEVRGKRQEGAGDRAGEGCPGMPASGDKAGRGDSIREHRMAPVMSSLSAWRQIFPDHASAMSKRPKQKIVCIFIVLSLMVRNCVRLPPAEDVWTFRVHPLKNSCGKPC